ncbi:ATP-binding protein [Nocardioides sp. cx-169]|uniref:AlbA family DNA-binding domain-containing protein n=1 Tax=Nocardioides sp. cx-169 TaxID=2899080 RepID=UPI001E56F9E9|nr:ATP-binding protein [Nocardioides sp. cx-169]MCD4533558.1 ATP-binding protein [Nocardioides sp. cx-169]
MATFRSRRIEALFNSPIDQLSESHIQSLVTSGVEEAFDIDYKEELYGSNDSARRSLAGDVAAMANTAGGVIVLGVQEDQQARAVATPGVPLSDAETARMRQIVASLVAPHPTLDILNIPTAGNPSTGFYILAIARSASAPHAVLINDGLRYPRHNGATTRYLSEPEVAEAYRMRLDSARTRVERAEWIENQAIEILERDVNPWLLVSLVPALAGGFDLDQEAFRTFENRMLGREAWSICPHGVSFRHVRTSRSRLIAHGGVNSPDAQWASMEAHADGSGTYALRLPDLHRTAREKQTDQAQEIHTLVDDEQLVLAVLTGLMRLAENAQARAGVSGDVVVRARLLPSPLARAIEIGHTRSFGIGESRSSVAVAGELSPAETAAPVEDLLAATPTLIQTAARLTNEIAQSFGIAELGQLTSMGAIRRRYWSVSGNTRANLENWAAAGPLDVIDEVLG